MNIIKKIHSVKEYVFSDRIQKNQTLEDLDYIDTQEFQAWVQAQSAGANAIRQELDSASNADLLNLANILAGQCEFDEAQKYIDLALDHAEANSEFTTTAFTLYLTELCNLRCSHCFIYDDIAEPFLKRSDEMSKDDIVKIAIGLRLNETNRHLFLTGGEVFARPDFEEIASELAQNGVKFGFGTNGMFPDRLENLLKNDACRNAITGIQFSIDGTQEGHEKIRGKGTFAPLVKAIKIANHFSIPINACTVLQDGNEGCVSGVQQLVSELGITNHRFQLHSQADRLMTKDIDRYKDILEKREFHQAKTSPAVPGKGCLAGIQSCIIRSNGEVEACRLSAVGNVPHLVMGNMLEHNHSIDSLLASDQAKDTLRRVGSCPGCALYCAR